MWRDEIFKFEDLLAEGEEELQEVTDRLNITSKKYGMEINR